ncbi:DNA-binding MarR family transcriptional regulator [Microbacterium ginsengiterrae]|uniref:DNA-binding MarR family transcriptional regulator n=1 Tax=Microbacterium ginsengiterrae TaxID=546115 RepID=A0A7W9CB41_9MICO|nr:MULTISPECIES: MarR family winged helix-turn-helix transcriptional regulator [Microbacterium]MBB5742263.1 DNA-binding MarR family transcriptional regulator [Microbacterium ginsengiterrae]
MAIVEAEPAGEIEEAFAEFQEQLNLMFVRARSLWKDSAARIHSDLQPSGYKLLTFIAHAGTANAHHLAERFETDKSVVSRQVRMLEDLGLVESRPDDQDGRQRVLTVTPAARTALDELKCDNVARLRGILAELSVDEVQAASRAFRLLAEM